MHITIYNRSNLRSMKQNKRIDIRALDQRYHVHPHLKTDLFNPESKYKAKCKRLEDSASNV